MFKGRGLNLLEDKISRSVVLDDKTQYCGWIIDWEHGMKVEAAKIPNRASV